MKLLIDGIHCGACPARVTSALLGLDLGARVNFASNELRVEGRMSLSDAAQAVEALGFRIASVVDDSVRDTGAALDRRARRADYF
jgi:hypothetical protein